MSDSEIQRQDDESTPKDSPPVDPHVAMLRSLPRLRSIEAIEGSSKPFVPPPPMVSRIAGATQGCGGVLLTILGALMVLVALGAGYYLWGPILILMGGLLLLGGTGGVWGGRRTPVIASILVVVVMGVVGYLWESFIPAVGALSPLGSLGVFLSPLTQLMALLLVVALAVHLISLAYWKRLKPVTRRGIVIWAVVAGVLVAFALALHFGEQRQRESWFQDHLKTWTAEASADSLVMGANNNVTLGYSFLTLNAGDDSQLDVRLAELDAVLEAGASVVRLSASGDMVLEKETPRLFTTDDNKTPEEVAQERADRITRQQADEETFMTHLTGAGVDLYLSDSQYSPYLIVWANEQDSANKLTWDDFLQTQQERVRYYAKLYQPAIYEVVNDPASYPQYTGVNAPTTENAQLLDLWVTQTQQLIDIVHQESPNSRIGVTIAIDNSFDLDYYERVLQMDGVDLIGFRLFQPAAFDVIENVLAEHGHPADFGKQLWIVETWFGYCLAPQRSMAMDATWLEVVAAFASTEKMSAVLVSDYGCFLQKGGTLFRSDSNLTGRTSVWTKWRQLIAQWQPSK
jgi:hypothetical protein